MRAICPNCGGKIHTQPKGFIGAIAIGANGWMVQTATRCELCGVELTGKVTMTNYAVLARPAPSPILETGEAYRKRMGMETKEEWLRHHR